ncbi:MAG: tetratricopeptide repeat protein [Coleofasciculus sp. C3-bin4]|nr:tetratricopeptide repeat protein [Coleofasciculus sp. C3-bin4]
MLAVETKANSCVQVGRLISVRGSVQLKRQAWSDYHPTAIGAVLCLGDLLRPAKGARVIVQCADPNQNPWTVPDGVPSGVANGCREPSKPRYNPSSPIPPTRTETAGRIPYIISPRSTSLLNNKPTLRWQTVPGATSYSVRLSGPGVNWETEVSTTEVVYPGEPPLKPVEEGYLLTVEADNGEKPAKATFSLLNENNTQRVRVAADRIASQNLPEDAKALALADLYIGQELIAEAVEVLEASVVKGSQTAAMYHTLGDLYGQMELLSQAEKYYLKAFELAMTANDIEGQGAAAARLGEVYAAMGNSEEASRWQKEAQQRYQTLGVSLNPFLPEDYLFPSPPAPPASPAPEHRYS